MDFTRVVREAGLGEVVERYRQSILIELSFAIPTLLIGAVGLIWGDDVGRAIASVFLAIGLFTGAAAWLKRNRYLHLCTGGLLLTYGSVVKRAVAWDEVASVRVWVTRIYKADGIEDLQRCMLLLHNGKRLNLAAPPYVRSEQLAEQIEECVSELVYPRRVAELDRTGATEFGPITVATDGMFDRGRLAVWQDISHLQRGRVRFRVWALDTHRPVISRQVRMIPDVAVLMRIIAERTVAARDPH